MAEFLLLDCAWVIENEIAAGMKQADIAKTYRLAMRSENAGVWDADWRRVNQAIIARWSLAGLRRVKEMAHKAMPA